MKKLIEALMKLKVETGSLACLGCGYENSCSVRGCAIIRAAIEKLIDFEWIDPENELPDEYSSVLVLVSGQVSDKITFDHSYMLAYYCCEDGWIMEEFPEWENPKIHWWMLLPKEPDQMK